MPNSESSATSVTQAERPAVVRIDAPPVQSARRQTVCLAMIVKDEAPVIRRCLASVVQLIDCWIIADTGSGDGTQDIILETLRDIPGELHQRPWVDFAHNRSETLALARPRADYTLIIDADDQLVLPPGFRLPFLKADAYELEVRHMELRLRRTQLVRNALAWRYEGVLHEFLSCPGPDGSRRLPESLKLARLPGARIEMSEGGARRRQDKAVRYRRDAEVLRMALASETDPLLVSRYTFYLAQSLYDAGEADEALDLYRRRAEQGFWDQEVFVSLYRAAKLEASLARPPDEVIRAFEAADQADPRRAEAAHGGALYCRLQGRFQEGFDFAARALTRKPPPDGLYEERWIYDFGLLDEYAVNAYWTERYAECLTACRKLLSSPALPAADRPRVEANAEFAKGKLGAIS